MIRSAFLLLLAASLSPAWVESVEFPWSSFPKSLWERELVWMKNIGIRHVSLPPPHDPGQITDLLRIFRNLNLEADLQGNVPEPLKPYAREHGGPLTGPLPQPLVRLSALAADALTRSRELIASGTQSILWTDVEDTIDASGFHPGAVNFAGQEQAGTIPLRRNAPLLHFWNRNLSALPETGQARVAVPPEGVSVKQFVSDGGGSVVSIVNSAAKPWSGEIKALYPALNRAIALPRVTVPAHDALWLPVDVPIGSGSFCKACAAFASTDHLVYGTAELTDIEYENGILALEFCAPSRGEVILQLSREPSGPLVAGGKPSEFDWDEHTQRVRLPIPEGKGAGNRVRIGLAIDPPDATAFFDSAHVLLIGETGKLTAQFSSEEVAKRSRLRTAPDFPVSQTIQSASEITYSIKVPATAVHGDHAEIALEADGRQLSHARPQFLRPAMIRFRDAIDVHLSSRSALPLNPAVITVNQRSGGEVTLSIRNNAAEIRNFQVGLSADGLDFSPAQATVSVGALSVREISFHVFSTNASFGLHNGSATLSGAASATEPVRFLVIPPSGAVAWSTDNFVFLETAKQRATFMPGRWLEFIDKDKGENRLSSMGIPFTPGPVKTEGDALVFAEGEKKLRLQDLQSIVPVRR